MIIKWILSILTSLNKWYWGSPIGRIHLLITGILSEVSFSLLCDYLELSKHIKMHMLFQFLVSFCSIVDWGQAVAQCRIGAGTQPQAAAAVSRSLWLFDPRAADIQAIEGMKVPSSESWPGEGFIYEWKKKKTEVGGRKMKKNSGCVVYPTTSVPASTVALNAHFPPLLYSWFIALTSGSCLSSHLPQNANIHYSEMIMSQHMCFPTASYNSAFPIRLNLKPLYNLIYFQLCRNCLWWRFFTNPSSKYSYSGTDQNH